MNPRHVPLSLLLALKLSKSEQSKAGSERPNQMGVGVGWSVCGGTGTGLFAGPQPKPTAILAWPSWALPAPLAGLTGFCLGTGCRGSTSHLV